MMIKQSKKAKVKRQKYKLNVKNFKFFLVILTFSFLLLNFVCLLPRQSFAETIDRVVATVNDQSITASEIDKMLKPVKEELEEIYKEQLLEQKLAEARHEIIERLVEEKLILQEAKSRKLEVKSEEIEERIQQVKSKFPDKASFEKALRVQGMNMWELKKTYKEQIMIRKMVRQYVREHLEITPVQISEYYQKRLNDFKLQQAVGISQILIRYKPTEDSKRTEKVAYQVMELLTMGADFSDVAKKYSEGPNAAAGGDLGMVERGTMTKEIDDCIFNMKVGEISKPIKTKLGFSIIKLNSIQKEQYKPVEELKGQIEEILLDEGAKTVLDKWVKELKEKAFISIKG